MPRRLGYLPWMDGMRAIAVAAVMVFHETIVQPFFGLDRAIAGGWLGVDVFFAISGFLITTLLLQEAAASGRIHFGAFYVRRARRLAPALLAMLVVVAIGALLLLGGRERISALEHVAIAAVYATNWVIALTGKPLHDLNHTWSLAAEEQFYLIWPAFLTLLIVLGRRYRHAVLLGVGAVAVLAVLWPQVTTLRDWSFNRVYYGLDTRAASLGVGSLLGAMSTLGLLPSGRAWVPLRRLCAVVGAATLVLVIHDSTVFDRAFTWVHLDANHARNGVFAIVGLATTLVIWELIESAPHLGHRLLSWSPLVFMGRISYGLYLWDAVIALRINPSNVHGWSLAVLHVVLTFAAAIASWFLIESRFRTRRPAAVS